MTASRASLWIALAAWAAAMFWSAGLLFTPPAGDGFTRGLNRIGAFFGWQVAAAILAIAAWWLGRKLPRSMLRRVSRVPLVVTALLALGLGATVGYVVLTQKPSSPPPRMPPTAPAAPDKGG